VSAALLQRVALLRAEHDRTCRWQGTAVEIHFNPQDAGRLGVEDGEDLCGLRAVCDPKLAIGRTRIYCDLELGGAPPRHSSARSTSTSTPLPVRSPTPVEHPLVASSSNSSSSTPPEAAERSQP